VRRIFGAAAAIGAYEHQGDIDNGTFGSQFKNRCQ
jgi:hypothetical protein